MPDVIGHCDWWAGNVRWQGKQPLVVHDWDSAVAMPEAAVAGVAAAVHEEAATVEESAVFLAAYEAQRGRRWTPRERHVAWAAGLWCRAFDAKKQVAEGGGTQLLDALQPQLRERLRLAGLNEDIAR